MSNDGMNFFPTGMPRPRPKPTLTGAWSDPYFSADPDQQRTMVDAVQGIRNHYSAGTGAVYAVDPKVMGMEHGIDIHQQIQNSIDSGHYMRGVLDQAIKSGRPVPFDSAKWGLHHDNLATRRSTMDH